MPKTLTFNAFTYDELSDQAKEQARQWYIEGMDNESYGTQEVLTQALQEAAMSDMKVYWSLGNCQGDGVAFEGDVDVHDFLKKQLSLQYQIAHQKNCWSQLIDPEHVDPAVQVGVKATCGIDYSHKDAAGVAIKNQRGGYDCFSCIRPSEDGAVVTAIEIIPGQITKPRKVRITQESEASPGCVERFKQLAVDGATLAFMRELLARDVTLAIKIKHQGRYTHWNSMDVTMEATDYGPVNDMHDAQERNRKIEEIDNVALDIQEGLAQFVKDISKCLERLGYDNIEDCTSEEAVAENIATNDYLFTASGSRRITLNADQAVQPAV